MATSKKLPNKMLAVVIALVAVVVAVGAVLALVGGPQEAGVKQPETSTGETQAKLVPRKVVFVVNPGVSERVTVREAKELEEFLEKELGVDVEIYYPLSIAALVEALRFKHADVALGVGTLVSAIAVREADVEMVLVEARDVVVENRRVVAPYYFSYFIVLKDSPYVYLDELRGKRACFPHERSVSGFVMPMKFLKDHGFIKPGDIKEPADLPRQFFGEVIFGGGYAQCWEALKQGRVDVTVMAGDVALRLYWEAMNNSRVLLLRDGREAKAGPNPSHTVLIRRDLPPELKSRIKQAVLKLNERPDLMQKYVSAIFVRFEERTLEEHLGPLIAALEELGLKNFYLR